MLLNLILIALGVAIPRFAFADCGPSVVATLSPTSADLESIHGSGREIWAVGNGVALRWDGTKWRKQNVPDGSQSAEGYAQCPNRSFQGVWVNSSKDVWIGCNSESDSDGIGHWNGKEWSYLALHANRAVNSLWSDGPGNVWAVEGNNDSPSSHVEGYAGHFDGSKWAKVGFDLSANGVWVTGGKTAWTLCNDTKICADDTSLQGADSFPLDDADPSSIYIDKNLGSNVKYTGKTKLHGIWGSGANDLWVVGAGGTALHFDGHTWSAANEGLGNANLMAIYGSKNSLWAVGQQGTIFRFEGGKWNQIPSPVKTDLRSVWVDLKGDAWIVGDKGVMLHASSSCSEPASNCGPRTSLTTPLREVVKACASPTAH